MTQHTHTSFILFRIAFFPTRLPNLLFLHSGFIVCQIIKILIYIPKKFKICKINSIITTMIDICKHRYTNMLTNFKVIIYIQFRDVTWHKTCNIVNTKMYSVIYTCRSYISNSADCILVIDILHFLFLSFVF